MKNRKAVKMGVLMVGVLLMKLNTIAAPQNMSVDTCNGQYDAVKSNISAVGESPASFIEAAGYYTLTNRMQQAGSVIYRMPEVETVTVYAYTPFASFVSWQDGQMIRGYSRQNLNSAKARLMFDTENNALFALQNSEPLFCLIQGAKYCMLPGSLRPGGEQPFSGLNIDYSTDGQNYRRAETVFSVNPQGLPVTYLEQHTAAIPENTQSIRLSILSAARLTNGEMSCENNAEKPLSIYRVEFKHREKPPESSAPPDPPPVTDPKPDVPPPSSVPNPDKPDKNVSLGKEDNASKDDQRSPLSGPRETRRIIKEERAYGENLPAPKPSTRGLPKESEPPAQTTPSVVRRSVTLPGDISSSPAITEDEAKAEETASSAIAEPPELLPPNIPATSYVLQEEPESDDAFSSFVAGGYTILTVAVIIFLVYRLRKKN